MHIYTPSVSTRPFIRATSLEALRSETFDVVVIGGGVTGAGVVLDAASRGLRAALIERDDFASGTSSKSSKLIHGGLRYLQQGEIGLVYEALAERQRLLQNAPHLVKPLPFLIPMFGKNGIIPAKIARLLGGAMWGYDLTGGLRIGKKHQRLNKAEALAYMPTLPQERLVSAYLYFDAAADDARLVVALLRTAALEYGAVIANEVAATGLSKDVGGRVTGVSVMADGEEFTIAARSVVNAAGVWSDDVRSQDEGKHPDSIRPAKGIHITVPWELVRNEVAAVIPVPKDRRSVFIVPLGALTYVGTTDTDYDGPIDDPQCTSEDIDYLLGALNGSCTTTITRDAVVGTWAGLRPLVKAASSGRTADLSRKHNINRSISGLVTITGGKLTTYREMAADTVDEVTTHVLQRNGGTEGIGKSCTKNLRIRGTTGYATLASASSLYPAVSTDLQEHLANRYGGEARVMLAAIQQDPTLGETIVSGLPYTKAEVQFAVRHEMANSIDDVLSRRTRARIYARDDSADAADAVAELMALELGWDDVTRKQNVEAYRYSIEHEREAAGLPKTHLSSLLQT